MMILRLVEQFMQLALVVAMGGVLATGLRDLARGRVDGDDIEEAIATAFRQMRALFVGRLSWREWQSSYTQMWLILGLAFGLAYDDILTGIIGAWMGLLFGALIDARMNKRDAPSDDEVKDEG